MAKPFFRILAAGLAWAWMGQVLASSIDLSKAANMGPGESFDEVSREMADAKAKSGFASLPIGQQTFRGVPFLMMDPAQHGGNSFVVLKGRKKPGFPEGVSISAGGIKAPYLYFLHTCRWGGTASNITVAEYDIVYDDGQIAAIPLRVGVEFTNFFRSDDTSASYLAWWHKYKNIEMGVNFLPWKNPHPEKSIQSILFKSRGNMPVPILFAITASDKELPISPDSPKPEKEFKTDTTKWIPFEPSDLSPAGTAIDMSFLLDAPAGKHGKVKADGDRLVFEDGTPAKFWGIELVGIERPMKPDSIRVLVDRLSASGCNAVILDGNFDRNLFSALKNKGIYLCVQPAVKDSITDEGTPQGLLDQDDPAMVTPDLFKAIDQEWGVKLPMNGLKKEAVTLSPTNFIDTPMVAAPEMSLPFSFSSGRELGSPFAGQWMAFWPNEFLGEAPLIISSYASLEGWVGSFGMNSGYFSSESLNPCLNPFVQNQIFVQWPTAALAYLRGDIKEGKVFVIGKEGSALKVLAHKSGLNPEGGKFKTDRSGELKAKVNEKTKSFVSDTGQISWQGNVGVVKVEASRFQALIGFLSHRKFNNTYWAVETPNAFASLSAISLSNKALNVSEHLLLTGVTRMENTGQTYNAAKTKLLTAGRAPILVEPLSAKIVLYRFIQDPKLRVRALDANGQPLKTKVSAKWVKNSFVFSWVPSAFYLEVYK